MDTLHSSCCGLDVHRKTVVACVLKTDGNKTRKQVRVFKTMTQDILALSDWLQSESCMHVAMDSTGVYWKPIYNLLEGHFELLVVNAQHMKALPGRKTDVAAAEWIADLLRHGLLRGSFIPDAPQRELIRYRRSLVEQRARLLNRTQKVLEDANIKWSSVVSNIMSVSARAMLEALLAG